MAEHRQGHSIHIIDDEIVVIDSLSLLLRLVGIEVTGWSSSRTFLAESSLQPDQLLLVDLNMPELDGIKLLHHVRARGWNNPALLMTGQADRMVERDALRVGFSAILNKPFSQEELISALDGISRSRR